MLDRKASLAPYKASLSTTGGKRKALGADPPIRKAGRKPRLADPWIAWQALQLGCIRSLGFMYQVTTSRNAKHESTVRLLSRLGPNNGTGDGLAPPGDRVQNLAGNGVTLGPMGLGTS